MTNRLTGLIGLIIFYAFLVMFGIVFVKFMEWVLEIPVMAQMVIGTMVVISTITTKEARGYWKQLILGRDNKGSIPENKEPECVFEDLKENPKEKPEESGHLKGNPLHE